tara:strand:- start:173 stop:835 length:663 start_codon:yes stop_codon:yes gene_type:complete
MNRLNILVVSACSLLLYTSKVQAEDGLGSEPDMGTVSELMTSSGETGALSDMPELVEVKIRHGDSLYDLAKWSNTQIDIIENLNGVDTHDQLAVGGGLLLPMTKIEQAEFHTKRMAALAQRRDGYLKRYGGLNRLKSHEVKQGQTVWRIARESGGVPLWLVQSYNPNLDLSRVQVGQTIVIPIIGASASVNDLDIEEEKDMEPAVDGVLDEGEFDEESGC